MKVILISGKAQHGKDTVASMMRDKFLADKHSVLVTHYADLLKWICTNYFGWDGAKDEKGRRLLQYVGTDVIRKQHPTLWVEFVAMMLKLFNGNWEYVIIPDCRFPNEITVIKDAGFDAINIRVNRPNFKSPLTEEQQKHISETALDDFDADVYINNTHSLFELRKALCKYIEDYLYE